MDRKRKDLSHSEVWDDSALINSWNEALQEYKHYHSLHARGEKVEEILQESEDLTPALAEQVLNGDDTEDGEIDEEADTGQDEQTLEEIENNEIETVASDLAAPGTDRNKDQNVISPDTGTASRNGPGISLPDNLTFGIGNEALKNLMMSWYYAGYYTGFYEGQQAMAQAATRPLKTSARENAADT